MLRIALAENALQGLHFEMKVGSQLYSVGSTMGIFSSWQWISFYLCTFYGREVHICYKKVPDLLDGMLWDLFDLYSAHS